MAISTCSADDLLDVIVVGGGPAGLSAALVLGRCRRRTIVFDAGHPRNEASHALHGFLTRDGISPAEFLKLGREQLARYDTVSVPSAKVTAAERGDCRFTKTIELLLWSKDVILCTNGVRRAAAMCSARCSATAYALWTRRSSASKAAATRS